MRTSLYDFNRQICHMKQIFQCNIYFAEIANKYLQRIAPEFIRRAVRELKVEYEEEYLIKKDEDKLHSIKQTLNMIAKERVTNIDELFMGLGFEVNAYYGVKHFNCMKSHQYRLQCKHCGNYISNHFQTLKYHEAKCQRMVSAAAKKIKRVDTKEKYERRQMQGTGEMKMEEEEKKPTKKQLMAMKRERKLEEDTKRRKLRKIAQNQLYDGQMNFNHLNEEMCYFQQDDEQLMLKQKEEPLCPSAHEQKQPSLSHTLVASLPSDEDNDFIA